ncbi:MAG: ribonuclease P protein component [Rhodospirillales bacterium]|nr:ribonuclease P protein component [Rhodospirillales bacterium]MDP6803841.1 ribonuclease P protein component [Rhodospirillales bacterium]
MPIGAQRAASVCPPSPFELAAVLRIKRRVDFVRVARAGRKWVAPGLILQVLNAPEGGNSADGRAVVRVGFTVSRKVGNAVVRNRVRRRLRAAVGEVMPAFAGAGHDFVVIGRAATRRRPYASLITDLKRGLKRLDVFEDRPTEAASKGGAIQSARLG